MVTGAVPMGLGELSGGPPTQAAEAEGYIRSKTAAFRRIGPLMFKDWQLAVRLAHTARSRGDASALRLQTLANRLQRNHERWSDTIKKLDGLNAALRVARLPELGAVPVALIATLAIVAGAMWYTFTEYATDSQALANERKAAEIRDRELALVETGQLTAQQYAKLPTAPGSGDSSVASSGAAKVGLPDAVKWGALGLVALAVAPLARDIFSAFGPRRRR